MKTFKCPICEEYITKLDLGIDQGVCPVCDNLITGISYLQKEYSDKINKRRADPSINYKIKKYMQDGIAFLDKERCNAYSAGLQFDEILRIDPDNYIAQWFLTIANILHYSRSRVVEISASIKIAERFGDEEVSRFLDKYGDEMFKRVKLGPNDSFIIHDDDGVKKFLVYKLEILLEMKNFNSEYIPDYSKYREQRLKEFYLEYPHIFNKESTEKIKMEFKSIDDEMLNTYIKIMKEFDDRHKRALSHSTNERQKEFSEIAYGRKRTYEYYKQYIDDLDSIIQKLNLTYQKGDHTYISTEHFIHCGCIQWCPKCGSTNIDIQDSSIIRSLVMYAANTNSSKLFCQSCNHKWTRYGTTFYRV